MFWAVGLVLLVVAFLAFRSKARKSMEDRLKGNAGPNIWAIVLFEFFFEIWITFVEIGSAILNFFRGVANAMGMVEREEI